MKLERTLLSSVIFLVTGIGILWSRWHGSAGLTTGYPLSQTVFQFGGNANGIAAIIGPLFMLIGTVLLLVSAVLAVNHLADARKKS